MCVEKPAWDIWRPNAVPFLLVPADKDNINTQESTISYNRALQISVVLKKDLAQRI